MIIIVTRWPVPGHDQILKLGTFRYTIQRKRPEPRAKLNPDWSGARARLHDPFGPAKVEKHSKTEAIPNSRGKTVQFEHIGK